MYAKLVEILVTNLLLPLLKDLAFMLYNMFKVRQIRKEREEAARLKAEAYAKAKTEEEIKNTFDNLP
jgi:hypothetical protein